MPDMQTETKTDTKTATKITSDMGKFKDLVYTRIRQLDDYVCHTSIVRVKDFYENFITQFENQCTPDKSNHPIVLSIITDHDVAYGEMSHISQYITKIFDSSFTLPFDGSCSNNNKRHLRFVINM